jgi:hypothetical protein
MNAQKVSAMTADEIAAVVRQAVREELLAAGLRLDGPEHQDEAKEDFRFVRRLRKTVDGASSKVGATFIMILISGVLWLFWQGAQGLWSK